MTDKTKTPMSHFEDCTLDQLPTTNPPAEYSDLGWRPEGERLFRCPDLVLETPDLIDLWKVLCAAAQENPLVKVEGHEIRRVMDGAEIDRQIAEKRENYFSERRSFHRIVNGTYGGKIYDFTVSEYMRREGIEWDKEWADEKNGND